MKRLLSFSFFIFFVSLISIQYASADFLILPENGINSIKNEEMQVSPEGINLHVKNRPLFSVLQRLQNETGIRFKLNDGLITEKVTVNITALNWKSLVSKLLGNFSKLELWGPSLETSSILVLERSEWNPAPLQKSAAFKKQAGNTKKARFKSKRKQPKVFPASTSVETKEITLEMIPHALIEPGFIPFLESQGVEIPQTLKADYQNYNSETEDSKVLPHIFVDPLVFTFLNSRGIQAPTF